MIGEDEKQDRRILHEPSVVNYAKQSNRCRHHDVVAIPTSDEFFDPTGCIIIIIGEVPDLQKTIVRANYCENARIEHHR